MSAHGEPMDATQGDREMDRNHLSRHEVYFDIQNLSWSSKRDLFHYVDIVTI